MVESTAIFRTEPSQTMPEHDHSGAGAARLRASDMATNSIAQAFGHLLDHVALPVWFKGLDRRYLYANHAWASCHGLTPTDLLGLTDEEVMPGCARTVTRLLDEEALGRSDRVVAVESVTFDGREAVNFKVSRQRALDGNNLAGLACIAEPMPPSAADAAAGQRAMVQQFAQLAHEFRSPLAGISGLAGCLARGGGLNDRQSQMLLTLQSCCDHLLDLSNEMVDFDRAMAGQLRVTRVPTDLGKLVQDVTSWIRPRIASPHVVLQGSVDPAWPAVVMLDPLRVRQVLMNLLSNAVRHTRRGFVAVRLLQASPHVMRVEVEDSGPGIAESDQVSLFQLYKPLSALDRVDGTTGGLGLPLSDRIVRAMGGELRVRSRVGEGTLVWFEMEVRS